MSLSARRAVEARRWRVGRTHEELPCEQYVVYRTALDGSREIYQYADTRAEATALAREATIQVRP